MREIKFRGKRVDNGEWVYGSLVINTIELDGQIENQYKIQDITYGLFPNDFMAGFDEVVDPATVGQYTGLHDKNGREIWEGDIIKAVALANDHNQRGAITISAVEYWMGNACLKITYIPLYPFIVDHSFEVIGNIYDNPDLLSKEA
jgi:uncharacterized phage protein (TIGR01671 family)